MRRHKAFSGDPWELFTGFASDAPYAAFIDLEEYAICSASPELFFDLHERTIRLRPMKGTAPRGMTLAEDRQRKKRLQMSAKDHAENAMILDMIRNDIGKIADVGSISVDESFQLEKYPTVWQMTSSVSARTSASVCNLMLSLFPCASITGAPKVNTMNIINSLEDLPREIYTGCMGFFSPKGDAQFNVAIRTALINKKSQSLNYGIGAGIVWDSVADFEYEECQLKARVINSPMPCSSFSLIETILWRASGGYFLLEYHLKRMKDSAEYFDFPFDETELQARLGKLEQTLDPGDMKVRVLLDREGGLDISVSTLPAKQSDEPQTARLAEQAVSLINPYLYHKTTRREAYERAQAAAPDCNDVILTNEQGEVTESTIANVVVRSGTDLITPPVACGLLAGTFRQYLLDKGEIKEAVISRSMLMESDEIHLVNSVRQWQRVVLLD
jgi:para-aminobenzoate synthetase/4-amino-4-deoxychorismate lyase